MHTCHAPGSEASRRDNATPSPHHPPVTRAAGKNPIVRSSLIAQGCVVSIERTAIFASAASTMTGARST